MMPCHDALPWCSALPQAPKTVSWPRTKISGTVSQMKYFLLKAVCPKYFVTVTKKRPTQNTRAGLESNCPFMCTMTKQQNLATPFWEYLNYVTFPPKMDAREFFPLILISICLSPVCFGYSDRCDTVVLITSPLTLRNSFMAHQHVTSSSGEMSVMNSAHFLIGFFVV